MRELPMKTILANTLGDSARDAMSAIFVDGFYQWLNYFSKDKELLRRTFRHIFNMDVFYLGVDNDDAILGMAACRGEKALTVRLDKGEFRKHLGLIRGSFAHRILHKEFEVKQYPFPVEPSMGMIEFVAVDEGHRGKGVASQLLQDIFVATSFDEYVLEVADTNMPAMKTYEKLGFSEFMRVVQKPMAARRSGVNALVYMKRGGKQDGES